MKAIETQIDIRADAALVWSVLTDFAAYPDWNPLIKDITGDLRRGGRLRVRIALRDRRPATFRPRVITCQPGRELTWIGRVLVPGVFDGCHTFRIAQTGSGVLVHHCERFTGLFSAFFGQSDLDAVREGFEAMNTALKARCEALAVTAASAAAASVDRPRAVA